MSLRRKFALVLATFAVALAAGFGWLTWRISSEALEDEMDRRLVEIPRSLVASGALQASDVMSFRPGDEDDPFLVGPYRERLQSLRAQGFDAFVFDAVGNTNLVSADPEVLIGDTLWILQPHRRAINRALEDGSATTQAFAGDDGRMYKWGFVLMEPGETAMVGVLIPADFFEPLARLRRLLLVGAAIAILLSAALAALLATNIARPLERLARVALRIQRGHMEVHIETDRGDEIGRLSRAMERMREGILERDEQLRLMLAQVAHEIRNPLGGLELFASAAAEANTAEERMRFLARMRDEVGALNRIIDDFLTFARPVRAEPRATDVRTPVQAAADLSEAEMATAGVTLEVSLPKESLDAVVDEDRVKRAVLNLLRNAAQAASGRVLVQARKEESEVVIVVTDDGPGVPEDRRARVFEPFVTDKEKGAGLGLAIVQKVVEAQGGRVEVDDASVEVFGSGAEFRIYFPGLEEPPPEARAPY